MKKTLFFSALVLMAIGLGSCAKEGGVDRGDINGAIKITAEKVTATSACIKGVCAQENVVGCYYVKPFETSQAKMVDMDAIDRKAYILEHGVKVSLPLVDSATVQLLAGTKYTAAVIGYDKDGVFRTAPYYVTFETGKATVSATALQASASVFDFTYSIAKGENTSYVKYIASTDKAVTPLDSDALKALIQKGGSAVQTTKSDIPEAHVVSAEKCDFVIAALAYDDLDRPGDFSTTLLSTETIVKVVADGKSTTLSKAQKDVEIFEGTVDMPATGSFTINISGKDYGFTSYSGAGGLGTVNSQFSALPFYNMTSDMTYKFNVSKAIGQMTSIEDGGNAFWLNMSAGAKANVKIDLTNQDGKYRYYFEIPQTDNSIVLYEGFDLCVWGGQYQCSVKGSLPTGFTAAQAAGCDGTEACTASAAGTTGMGVDNFCYPSTVELSGSETHASETLMKNWGLQDWTFKKGYLAAGHARVAASAVGCSYLYTPKFKSLTAATNLTFTTECWSFAADFDKGLFYFEITGAGRFASVTVTNTAGFNENITIDGTKFTPTAAMVPQAANTVVNKTIAKFVFKIEGATADTQLRLGTSEDPAVNNKQARICVDYIKVTK